MMQVASKCKSAAGRSVGPGCVCAGAKRRGRPPLSMFVAGDCNLKRRARVGVSAASRGKKSLPASNAMGRPMFVAAPQRHRSADRPDPRTEADATLLWHAKHANIRVFRASRNPQLSRPWQCLYFFPDPHGQGALRDALRQVDGSFGSTASDRNGAAATATEEAAAPSSAISGSPA